MGKYSLFAYLIKLWIMVNIFYLFQFLGDEETVKKAMEAVAAQGKAKKQNN